MVARLIKQTKANAAFLARLFTRMVYYTIVGAGTFILDLAIIHGLVTYTDTSDTTALVIGFVVGITLNYLLSFYWVYRGTKRNVWLGYAIFIALAVAGSLLIVAATTFLTDTYALPLLLARTIVAAFVGLANFLINTFFNFRLV